MKLKQVITIVILFLMTLTGMAQRPGYWQQHVDYKMNIDVNEVTFQYDGEMTLKYSNNSTQDLSKVYFHLYFNAFQPGSMMDERLKSIVDPDSRMVTNIGTKEKPQLESRIEKLSPNQIGFQKIKSIKFNGAKASFIEDGTILEVVLPKKLKAGTTAVFELTWQAQVPEQIRRSGRNSKEGVALSMTQWYPKMAHFDEQGWHLDEYVGREFIAPFGDFDVQIQIHKDYIIGSSGRLQNPKDVKGYVANPQIKLKNNKATWHFKAKNIHDFAWAADPKFVVDSTKTKSNVTLYTVFLPTNPEVIANWKTALNLASEFFDLTGKQFGAYPWDTYTIVQGGDGGMEYGTVTLITGGRNLKGLVGVIFHEAAHSWFQHLYGINETVDEWMDEGFTSYIEELGMSALFEKPAVRALNPIAMAYAAYYKLAKSGKEEPMSLLADYYHTNYAYSNQAYNKGAVYAEQLGYIIGRDNLHQTFLKFYDLWKFKHPTPNDFKRIAEEVSGINLKWYNNLFINTTRVIDYALSAENSKNILISNKSNFAMPLDVLVEYEDGTQELFYIPLREMRGYKPTEEFSIYQGVKRTVLTDWFWTKPTYTIALSKPAKVVQIDPTERLADINQENNSLKF
ncbi:M1 family metallopeptidase [Sphingobacterium sp. HJSM2_6]|uniref:M1 family metallopeptidase n=1 Tax=Sphingobacterium sp. HJSM2_6 TaxID=3366264 RepID=UPI003BD85067